ncbi:MAG: hypothetical protein WC564_03175 [Patescibacteria group bacterium]|jgi:hypothetical protein
MKNFEFNESNSSREQNIEKLMEYFDVSIAKNNWSDKSEKAMIMKGILNDIRGIEFVNSKPKDFPKDEFLSKINTRLEKYKNTDEYLAAELMSELIKLIPIYITGVKTKIIPKTKEWVDFENKLKNSRFLQREFNEQFYNLYIEDYINKLLPEELNIEFLDFLQVNPAYFKRLEDTKKYFKEQGDDFNQLVEFKNQYESYKKYKKGEMSKREEDEYFNSVLDQGKEGIEKLKSFEGINEEGNNN